MSDFLRLFLVHELIFLSFVINSSRYGFSFYLSIQLFQERLSEKVHATIPKGIVGDFEFFEEISKNCTRSHAPMFASAKGKQHK